MSFNISSSMVPISDTTASYPVQQDQRVLEVQETPEETQLSSYADLAKIQVDSNSKNELKKLSDPIKKELKGIFGNTWYRFISNEEVNISITDAVRIHHNLGREDIFKFNGDSIKIFPVTDKISELTTLRTTLVSQKLMHTELGTSHRTFCDITSARQQWIAKKTAEKLNSIYMKHMEGGILFDFNSVLSKAVQEAKNRIEKERTHPQFSSASKKRPPSDESISLQGAQPQRKKRRSDNSERGDQQQRTLKKVFKTPETSGAQNPQPVINPAFSSQQEQYPVDIIQGQYYQNTPY
ncbi:MAG TPA: hypothetical protein VNX68_10465, partial [Nitrosopumilaceae archaeon]|nr:hypothetical protein [Nitrosopumilaceae archaeon]